MRYLFVSFLFCFVYFNTLIQTQAWEGSGQTKVLKVAGDNQFPPFEYMSSSGVYTGFNIDVMNAVSLETSIQLEFYPMPWNKALEALREGRIDMVQGMKYSERRDELYDFTESYFTSSQGIFVLKENVTIHHVDDLEDKEIVLQKGDIAYDVVDSLERAKVEFAENQEQAIQLLLDHKVDAFLGNRITGQYILQKMGRQEEVKIVGDPVGRTQYSMVVMPNNQELLEIWNQGIQRIKKNGTYDKIQNKWFGEYSLPRDSKRTQDILRMLQYALAAIFIIAALILWWNLTLKKEVRRRIATISKMNELLKDKMQELKESDQFKQQLLDSAYSSFVTLDEKGCISLFNLNAMKWLKWDQHIKGKKGFETILAEFIPVEQMEQALREGTPFLHQESLWGKEKETCISYNIFPIASLEGGVVGAIISFMDITKQKKLIERIQREDRLRSLGKMISGVAHEIRNPLMSILTYTQLLPKKFDSPPFRQVFLEQVPAEIERLNHIVTDLVDFARPKKAQPMLIEAHSLVESVLFLFQQKAKEKGIELHVEIKAGTTLYADPGQVKQGIINLMTNALDATSKGKSIWLRAYPKKNQSVIEVQDEGSGIEHEIIRQIYEPFFTTKPEGVGLGLSISYQLMKENHGTIEMDSHPGEGTIFKLLLPRKEERDRETSDGDR